MTWFVRFMWSTGCDEYPDFKKVFEMRLQTIWCVDNEVSDVNKSFITDL